jgi:hypothetical protein
MITSPSTALMVSREQQQLQQALCDAEYHASVHDVSHCRAEVLCMCWLSL